MIRLLFVDDDAGMIEIVRFFLEADGKYEMDAVTSAKEGMEKLNGKEYDAVISDYQMPQCNGIEFLLEVRKSHPKLPFVFFTCANDPEMIRVALNHGADLIVDKSGNIITRLEMMMDKVDALVDEGRRANESPSTGTDRQLLMDSISDMMLVTSRTFKVRLANRAAMKAIGMCEEREWYLTDVIHQDDAECAESDLLRSLEERKNAPVEFRMRSINGYLWVEAVPSYCVENGVVTGIVLVMRDIDGRRETMMELIEQNKKLDLILGLTRHDLLNNVSSAETYLQTLSESLGEKHKKRYVEKALDNLESMRSQLQLIKQYQDLGMFERQWIDVGEAIDLAASQVDLGTVLFEHDLNGMKIKVDPMLDKVFYNILSNSVKHGDHVTHISALYQTGRNGITIVIEDDGVGIPSRDKRSIFEYGYKERRGHGLHFVNELLARSGMSIREVGTPGLGSKFEIFVPEGLYRHDDDIAETMGLNLSSRQRSASL
ncbi:MAG: sensory histidine kinase AtoS [Methanomassiliicoccales archaeon PtaU1.Bin124]|nr:MAG: sensory histidine kinase AtoS [Methanomassiliicoccales archaeon PtaU1.Bin124]